MQVELGFRAYDPHELLPHVLATRLGLYQKAGVAVRLSDLTFEDTPSLQVSCGAALLARLRGEPHRIVLVACRKPLFSIVTRGARMQLDRAHIASYPSGSPPALFARILLPDARLDPVRDDGARIGLLLAGEVDAAVVSSAESPGALERLGLHTALAFRDHLTVPTTGLAVPEPMLARGEVAALASALRGALAVLRRDHDEVVQALVESFRYDAVSARSWARSNSEAFSADGTVPRDEAHTALRLVAEGAGVAGLSVEDAFSGTAVS